jgi:hypothetical protein
VRAPQADDEGGFENLGFDKGQFEVLEADFENVLQELGADPQLERFRLEYETLYRALKKSHESENRLVKKCKELTADIASTVQKTASAVKLSADDQQQIVGLKQDILRTSTAVESSLLKEKETKEEVCAGSSLPLSLTHTAAQLLRLPCCLAAAALRFAALRCAAAACYFGCCHCRCCCSIRGFAGSCRAGEYTAAGRRGPRGPVPARIE